MLLSIRQLAISSLTLFPTKRIFLAGSMASGAGPPSTATSSCQVSLPVAGATVQIKIRLSSWLAGGNDPCQGRHDERADGNDRSDIHARAPSAGSPCN